MLDLHFHVGSRDEAMDLVCRFHYSGRWPSNVQVIGSWHENGGLFGDHGPMIATCVFAIPPTRWAEDVLELVRLVRRNDVSPPLTGLIASTVRHIKATAIADLLVSFADRTVGHHGGIYQAASWHYGGCRDRRMDGVIWRGSFVPGRSCNSRWGTRSPDRLREQGIDVEPHYDEGKHLYWRAIGRSGVQKAGRLGLEKQAYPKPDQILET